MDLSFISEYFVPVVVVGCLVLGYIIKTSFDFVPNKYIPTILAVVGAVLNCAVSGVSLENIIYGAVTGLASTGAHQAFKSFIEKEE